MGTVLQMLLLVLLVVLVVGLSAGEENNPEIALDKGVMVLNKDNFQHVIDSNNLVIVDFYAPWCKHCQKLELEFATAAWMISESPRRKKKAKFAKVDAIEQTDLAARFEITRYPTLLFFKNGVVKPFTGGTNADSIYHWVSKKSGDPARLIQTKEEFNKLVTKPQVAVLGFFRDLESKEAQSYLEAADENMIIPFGITSNSNLFSLFQVPGDSEIIVLKKFDEGLARLSGEITAAAVTDFVNKKSQPLVVEFKQETAKKIFQDLQAFPCMILFFSSTNKDNTESYIETMKAVAKDFMGDIKCVSVDTDVEENKRMMESLGVTEKELPTVRLTSHVEDLVKYKPDNEEITEDNLRAFVTAFKAGELKPTMNKQDLPEDWDKNPVKILVASNFDEYVSDTSKNVFVKFFAPWCGHCKTVAPVWDQLGEEFKDDENVAIAKLDLTANQMDTLQVKGFPTFKLYKAGDNTELDFTGPRNLEAFSRFLRGNMGGVNTNKEEL